MRQIGTPVGMMKRLAAAAIAVTFGCFASGLAPAARADEPYWQCVPFARMFSGVQIFGDAHTWWNQARDRYRTGARPETGAVLAFEASGRMSRGHVAVVSEVLTDRVIRVTHANWGGSRGKVEENVTVLDVSTRGDWSAVKVWYNPIQAMGSSVYPTRGFIYKAPLEPADGVLMAAAAASDRQP